jgi:cysteinyl-tRNA synthetase
MAALVDDLNTPQALVRLHELRTEARHGNIDSGAALTASLHLIGLCTESRESGVAMPTISHGDSESAILEAFMMLFPKNYPIGRAIAVLQQSRLHDLTSEVAMVADILKFVDKTVRAAEVVQLRGQIRQINERIADRLAARKAKNFKESDRIRDELATMGVLIGDTKDGTTWKVKR